LNLRPPGYEPGELPGCSTPRRGADCSTADTVFFMTWTIWLALIVAVVAVLGSLGFLAVRVLQGWRAFKRLRRHLGKELGHLTDALERTADAAEQASDTRRLDEARARLQVTLARFGVLREAVDEATSGVRRLAAVYPRK
jgi:hypothetical protein